MDGDHSPVRLDAAGSDPEEAKDRLSRIYHGADWTATTTEDRFSYRYAAIGDAAMTLRTSRMSGHLVGDVGVSNDIVVQWLVGGRATLDAGRSRITMEHGRPTLFPVGQSFTFEYVDFDQKLVHLDSGAVHRVAAERGVNGPLRFDPMFRAPEAAVQQWRRAVAASARSLRREQVDPLLWDELTRATVSALLELYPPESTPLPPDVLAPRNARLRAAVEFAHAHAAEPIGPLDLACAAGLSVRGLQSAFQRVLGMRPIAYLRLVRLDSAHIELAAASPLETTVGQVAQRWGFGNAGRFSAAYSSRFGELPSHTLQR